MVEKLITPGPNVIDFARYQSGRSAACKAYALSARACRHCGAALLDGENEDDCSSMLGIAITAPRARAPRTVRVD